MTNSEMPARPSAADTGKELLAHRASTSKMQVLACLPPPARLCLG